jgi:hypothetical protein
MIGETAQYQELVTLYGTYGDNELMTLGHTMDDLTDVAQSALRDELARRGLEIVPAELPHSPILNEEDLSNLRAYAESAPPECTFEFENEHGASAAYRALLEANIEAVVLSEQQSQLSLRGPRVVVAPKDAELATAILSSSLTDKFKIAEEDVPEEFALPDCPMCNGEETLLESVDPVNQWRCDDCGHTWLEEVEP